MSIGRLQSPLPAGSIAVGLGLLANGAATYGFLIVTRRTIGEGPYGSFAALWGLVFILGPGLFQPLEQELARATAHRAALQQGNGPVLRRAASVGVCSLFVFSVAVVAGWLLGLDDLFDHDRWLLIALLFALTGFMCSELLRGALSGRGLFRTYGQYVAMEGFARLLLVTALSVLGVRAVGSFAGVVGASFFVATFFGIILARPLSSPGPAAQWKELTPALGLLLATSLSEALLLNVGPLAVRVFSEGPDAAGRFLNGLIVARVPLFLFAAVKAALLPNLSALAAANDLTGFRQTLERLLAVVGAVVLVGTVGAAVVGPFAVRLLFGDEIASRDMALLAASSLGSMFVLSLAMALVALGNAKRAALGWLVGVFAFPLALLLASDPVLRVEIALVVAIAAAAAAMAMALAAQVRQTRALTKSV